MMIRPTASRFESVSSPPSPRTILGVFLAADLIALGAVIIVVAATASLLAIGIDFTRLVASYVNAGSDVLSSVSTYLVGGWALYTYLYLAAGLMAAATVTHFCCVGAFWTQVSQVLPCVLRRMAQAWHDRYPSSVPFLVPRDLLSCAADDRNPDHLASGWSAQLHPSLTYE